MDSKVEMHIPQQMIEDLMRAEIVRAIPNKEAMADSIVRQALTEKAPDRYGSTSRDSPSKFGVAVTKMIREEAQGIFKEWIEENRPLIRAAMVRDLTKNKQKHLKTFVDQLVSGIATYSMDVRLKIDGDDY